MKDNSFGSLADVKKFPCRSQTKERKQMDVSLILKVVGIGLIVAVSSQILSKYGRDDQATFVGISGIIVVLFMLVGELSELFEAVMSTFEL